MNEEETRSKSHGKPFLFRLKKNAMFLFCLLLLVERFISVILRRIHVSNYKKIVPFLLRSLTFYGIKTDQNEK